MIDTYKYVHGFYKTERGILDLAEDTGTIGNSKKLFWHHTHGNTRKHLELQCKGDQYMEQSPRGGGAGALCECLQEQTGCTLET